MILDPEIMYDGAMMPERKVALVTGAGIRVGKAIALELASAGYDILVHCHASLEAARGTAAEIAARGREAHVIAADLADEGAIRKLFEGTRERFGRLDLLVNCAARYERLPLAELTSEAWDAMLATNLRGPFLCCREAAALMPRDGGHIINILDVAARVAWKEYLHYCVSKAGLEMLTRVLALELAPRIRVNAVAPGTVIWGSATQDPDRDAVVRKIPLGRIGCPEDIGRTVAFLATGPAFITGQVIGVDGGRSINAGQV